MRGYGARHSSLGPDGIEHLWKIQEHVIIPESKHEPTQGFQLGLAVIIVQLRLILIVDRTVQFDDESSLFTGEVGEVAVDGMLAAKLQTIQTTASKRLP